MPDGDRNELLDATDDHIDRAVRCADPMVLRGLVYQLTGDAALAATKTQDVVAGFLEVSALVDEAELEVVYAKTSEFLRSYRDRGAPQLSIGDPDRLQESLRLTAGFDIDPDEMGIWHEQLATDPYARGVAWREQPGAAALDEFHVLVVGAGMGGLNAAVHLRRLGIPFRVVERNAEVGGTWFENRYPGARVDTPSRMYSHIFGVDYPFPNPFCAQGDNEKYFNWVADHFDIRDQIDFETELRSLTWDERTQHWIAHLDGPSGSRELRANAVICGTGTFSRPSIPAFEGVDDFGGVATHTARWPADLDLAGKRVGVVGSGCTGYQTVPEIVKTAAHTYLFQRTPNWCFEIEGYLSPYPPEVLWLERNLPYYTNFSRFRAGWLYGSESIGKIWKIDPDFVDPHTRSPLNKAIREQRLEFMQGKLASRPDLLAAMTPDAPPLAARPVLIDRDYSIFDVLLRDDMTLVSDSIERITEAGIETTAETVDLDVIVFATGFRTDDYLWPMTITGRHGSTLESAWKRDGARAYLGTMLPDFPNLFLIYGPNSNPVGGMTVIDMEEMTTRFAVGSIAGLIERGHSSVEVTHEAFDRYNREIDRLEPTKLYADARSTSYFLNAEGRSVVNNPIDGRIMWKWLRDPVTPGVMPIGTADLRPFFEGDLVTRNGLEA